MKKRLFFLIPLLMLCSCCTNPSEENTTTTTIILQTGYSGFLPLEEGQWSEYVYSIDGQNLRERVSYIGEENINGKRAKGIEIQIRNSTSHVGTFQVWADEATNEIILYAGRINGKVVCTEKKDVLGNITLPAAFYGTLHEYQPKNAKKVEECAISEKTIYCARFLINDEEVLASSQVPFGIVKKKDLELIDYGTGSERTITKKEIDSCTPI